LLNNFTCALPGFGKPYRNYEKETIICRVIGPCCRRYSVRLQSTTSQRDYATSDDQCRAGHAGRAVNQRAVVALISIISDLTPGKLFPGFFARAAKLGFSRIRGRVLV
jgi:hypothetical protein